MEESHTLNLWDILVVIIYFLAVIGVGIFASCRMSRGSVSGYFLAGRSMMWPMVGASLFVSNIGSEHFIGLAGSGAAGGIGVGAWEFNAILLLQLLGFVFIPVYIACGTYTCPQYLKKRFGGERIRVYFAVLSLILYILTKLSVDLYTGALFIQQSLGWDLYLSILVLIAITGVLTITGGLKAVIYTDTLQAFLMVSGALVLMIMAFVEVGGYDEMVLKYSQAAPKVTKALENVTDKCNGNPSPQSFKMLRDIDDNEMPWLGFLLGQTPGSIWYWCSDQVIVQRALAAKNLSHAQGATLMAGLIKILPLFIMVMPGMISRIMFPESVACKDPTVCYSICQSKAGCSNIAYPRLVLELMPAGLKGLMMAVMIAALMSDLDSIFNSASTLFTIDIYKTLRRKAGVRELMIVGRLWVVVMIVASVCWVPVAKEQQGGQVFIYIQEITNYFAPAVAATFLIAIFWKGCNEKGAFYGLMAGFITGVTRLILILIYPKPRTCLDLDTVPDWLKNTLRLHYMYFAMLLFLITIIVTISVSLLTKPDPPEMLVRTTFWTRYDDLVVDNDAKEHYETDVTVANADGVTSAPNLEDPPEPSSPGEAGDAPQKFQIAEKQSVPKATVKTFDQKLINFICGFGDVSVSSKQQVYQEQQRVARIMSLEQTALARNLLKFGMICLLLIGTFLYLWWSLWSPNYAHDLLCSHNMTIKGTVLQCL